MLIRKFKENPGLKSNLSERAVVLDPDLIDLTMIPPPMTPDEVKVKFIKNIFPINLNPRTESPVSSLALSALLQLPSQTVSPWRRS